MVLSGDIDYLKIYETSRQRHNMPTLLAIEGLYRLYRTSFAPIVLLRSLGLQATHALDPLKVCKKITNRTITRIDDNKVLKCCFFSRDYSLHKPRVKWILLNFM